MSKMTINFKVLVDGVLIKEQSISQRAIKIGSMASSQLHIDDDTVSKMHAIIEVNDALDVQILDLGSENGIVYNGQRVEKATLQNGARLQLGKVELQVTFQPATVHSTATLLQTAGSNIPSMNTTDLTDHASLVAANTAGLVMTTGTPGMLRAAKTHLPSAHVDLSRYEDILKPAVEVVVMWNNSVLQVQHYTNDNPKKMAHFHIGEDFTCDFPIPAESLMGQTKIPLVVNQLGGGATINILPGATGDVTYENGARISLRDLVGNGQAHSSLDIAGGHAIALPNKGRVKMNFGAWTFLVNEVPSPRKFVAPMYFDWTQQIYSGASAVLHSMFLFLIYFIPPSPTGLNLDTLEANGRFVKYLLTATEIKQEDVPKWLEKEKEDQQQGGKGKRHKGEEGQMGKRDSKKTDNRYGVKGPTKNPTPHMARTRLKNIARNAGILTFLSPAQAPTSPFGQDTALGADPENALGALMGNQIGGNFGFGGLGLKGSGRGAGGTGEGTIGLGNLRTIGNGGGGGTGPGYGRGGGHLSGRSGRPPIIRPGAGTVQGSLSKEVIRRIIHRHINEVRHCYEAQLASRPDLKGRVEIQFLISGTGAVQTAAVGSSTLGNLKVENCIANSVRRWTFPQPQGGGVVIVSYPFQLTSPN